LLVHSTGLSDPLNVGNLRPGGSNAQRALAACRQAAEKAESRKLSVTPQVRKSLNS